MNYKITNLHKPPSKNTVLDSDTADRDIQMKIASSFEELASVKEEWDEFMAEIGAGIFLTFDWCRLWWKYYGQARVLKIFVFRHQNRLVGIIPLFFEKLWLGPVYVKPVKIVGSDCTILQFNVPINRTYMEEVCRSFFTAIAEDNWDIMHLGPVAGLYRHYDDLKDLCRKILGRSYLVSSQNKGVQTYFKLTDTWDEYLTALNRKERTKIRRHYRLASKTVPDKTASVVANCATTENFQELFLGFVRTHENHWKKLGKLGHFGDWPSSLEFHRELAQVHLKQDRLRLIQVMLGNSCLGYKYGYIFGDNYVDFLDIRSDLPEFASIGLGRILYAEMIKKAIQDKARYIDSMRGEYKHKLEMGGELFPARNLYVVPKHWPKLLRVRLFRHLAYLLDLFYYRIWFGRIAPRLTHKRKPLWKIWIRTNAFS